MNGIGVDPERVRSALKSVGPIYKIKGLGIERSVLYRKMGGKTAWLLEDLNKLARVTGKPARWFLCNVPLEGKHDDG